MNTCENCNHEFEVQQGIIQICPMCGQEIDEEATIEDLILESSSVSDSTEDEDEDEIEEIFELEEETEVVTEHIDEEEILELDHPHSRTSDVKSRANKIDDVEPNQTTIDLDDSDAAATEMGTEIAENDDDGTDFELTDDLKTEQGTEQYDPDEKQPTIELEAKPVTAASLDYAEREIVGLSIDDAVDQDADYVIAINEKDSQLGSGASGIVYRATQKSLDRTVAIKLLKKQVKAGTQSQSRKTTPKQKDIEKFLYESQITAGLDHPNVITVHDLGVTSNNTLFYSMKLFEGGKDWSKDFDNNTLVENLDIFNDVCDAMRRAHRDRIIHRDLKPQNVLVGDFGEVQVTDWGLAIDLKDLDDGEFSGGGTPCYMAPEMSTHYLTQQELRLLKSKLEWAQQNTPNNSDEIEVFKERIAEKEKQEHQFGQLVNELSDVYVLGAILFQIAQGFPPHLYQISDIHRRKWGRQTGKNKVRRELEMSAKGTIASYQVRKKANPEASVALRDIATKAMAFEQKDRFQNVNELQQAVKDFRVFLRCVEDTHRGNREIELAEEDQKSYVNLNNAIYAYEGALENYPDYEPANKGLAKARFLFAERALNNQDFELGLSTMTDHVIAAQPDKNLATELRDELVNQRNRRDRRKRLLFLATMASLIAIGTGVVFGLLAIWAQQAARSSQIAANQAKNEANIQIKKANEAKQQQIAGLERLVQAKESALDLQVKQAIAELELDKIDQESTVAQLSKEATEIQARVDKFNTDRKLRSAELKKELADVEQKIAEIDRIESKIESEKIKEDTQFNQYITRLKNIDDNIDEAIAKTKLQEVFECTDISMPVKNSWELHHLFKRANPQIQILNDRLLGEYRLLESSASGSRIVVLANENQLFQFSDSDTSLKPISIDCLVGCNVLSLDVSKNGRWLVVARDFANEEFATGRESLPVIYDLELEKQIFISNAVIEELKFDSPKTDDNQEICKEKYYSRPQYVQFLDSSESSIRFFMVDQRARLGINQLRCSVLDLRIAGNEFSGVAAKAKVGGQMFLESPGLLTGTGCLASAVQLENGDVVAAVANSYPHFGVTVLSVNGANKHLKSDDYLNSPQSVERYFDQLKLSNKNLESISTDFAPTAMALIRRSNGGFGLFVGNGKGEIAEIDYRFDSLNSIALTAIQHRLVPGNIRETGSDSRLVKANKSRINVTSQRKVFSSTSSQIKSDKKQIPIHKSAVRKIEWVHDQLFSTSESEIVKMDTNKNILMATKTLVLVSQEKLLR